MSQDTLKQARQLQMQVEERWSLFRGKKNAVLHLRIEAEIMERLKAEAMAHSLSVSDFVRLRLIESFSKSVDATLEPEFLRVTTAWTEAVLMHETECAICGETMPKGATAWLAHGPALPARLICAACYDNLLAESNETLQPESGDE